MANVYLAFLGTSDYLPCTYYFGDREVPQVRFVQEATIQLCCRDWQPEDRILILTTGEACRKNWLDDGHRDRDGNPLRREGLGSCLGRLAPLAQVKRIDIPEGKNEAEIWQIFDILIGEFEPGDAVVLDITHALRSIPMLAIVALNYAKVMKGVTLQGIYYGAFEVLGSPRDAEKVPVEARRVPIFDLSPFNNLMDWSTAVDRFLGAGDAGPVAALAHGAVQPILRDTRGQDAAARAIRSLAQRLEDFTGSMATCRGPRLPETARLLRRDLEAALSQEIITPLKPLLSRLADRLSRFEGDFIQDGIQAAQWCLDHNLIQQGFTILQEFLVTCITRRFGLDDLDEQHRTMVNQAVAITTKQLPQGAWHAPARDHPDLVTSMVNFFQAHFQLTKSYAALTQYRNDLNHAAFRKKTSDAQKFSLKLQDLITAVQAQLSEVTGP